MFFDLPPQLPTIAEAVPTISIPVAERAQAALICAQANGKPVEKLAIFDANLPAQKQRFWLLDMSGPAPTLVLNDWVSHGSGSDPNRDGIAERFSNIEGSHMTSLGFYRLAERYQGRSGTSWRLDGLTPGFNDQARRRAVVIHPATYVTSQRVGRSQGCPALRQSVVDAMNELGTANTYLWIDGAGHGLESSPSLTCVEGLAWLSAQEERRQRLKETAAWSSGHAYLANTCPAIAPISTQENNNA